MGGCLIRSDEPESPAGAIRNAISTEVNLSHDIVAAHTQAAQVSERVNE